MMLHITRIGDSVLLQSDNGAIDLTMTAAEALSLSYQLMLRGQPDAQDDADRAIERWTP